MCCGDHRRSSVAPGCQDRRRALARDARRRRVGLRRAGASLPACVFLVLLLVVVLFLFLVVELLLVIELELRLVLGRCGCRDVVGRRRVRGLRPRLDVQRVHRPLGERERSLREPAHDDRASLRRQVRPRHELRRGHLERWPDEDHARVSDARRRDEVVRLYAVGSVLTFVRRWRTWISSVSASSSCTV